MNTIQIKYLSYRSHYNDNQVFFHPTQSSWIIVNPTAAAIVSKILEGQSVEMIAQLLANEYCIPYKQAISDVNAVYQTLLNNGFEFKKSYVPKIRAPQLKSMFLHITRRCNLQCPHCYINASHTDKDLPTQTILRLIDTLTASGGNNLTISGGEPLLHPGIEKILSHASSKLTVRLLTNGTKINDKMAKFLAENGIFIQISLDGSTAQIHDSIRGKGTFDQIMNAIQRLKTFGAGDRLNLCATIMQANQNDWPNMIALAEKINIPLLRFLHSREIGRAATHSSAKPLLAKEYEKFIAHITKLQSNHHQKIELTCGMSGLLLKMPEEFQNDDIWCPVGRMIVIDSNGDVFPCVLMMREEYKLGNIFSQQVDQIIQSSKMENICKLLSNRRYTIEKCRDCSFRNLCQAGCMGQALDHSNSLMMTDDFCQYRQKAYTDAFERLIQMSDSQ